MPRIVWPPSEKVLRKMERMGADASRVKIPVIRLYLLDNITHMNPLYGDADLLYGDNPGSNMVYGTTGEVWDGPYVLHGLYQIKVSDDVSVMADENGMKTSMSSFTVSVPRSELRNAKMVDVGVEEKIRLPSTGDMVEILDPAESAIKSIEKFKDGTVGPLYFVLSEVNFGKTIDYTDYWIELVLKGEATSKFDPARMVKKTSRFVPDSQQET